MNSMLKNLGLPGLFVLLAPIGCGEQPAPTSDQSQPYTESLEKAVVSGRLAQFPSGLITTTVKVSDGLINTVSDTLMADKVQGDDWSRPRETLEEEGSRQVALSQGIEVSPGFELSLTLAKSDFVVGEPIWVRATLTNVSDHPLEIAPLVDPQFTFGRVIFTSPDGTTLGLSPLAILCSRGDLQVETLAAGEARVEDFPVFFGRDGFVLTEPGSYGVQVLYRGITEDSSRIDSDLTWVTVRDSGLIDPVQYREAGLFMMWNEGDHLTTGISDLEALVASHPESTLADWARFALGRNMSVDFSNGITHQLRLHQPGQARMWLEPLLDRIQNGEAILPPNVVRDTYIHLAQAYTQLGKKQDAHNLLTQWEDRYGASAAPEDIALVWDTRVGL